MSQRLGFTALAVILASAAPAFADLLVVDNTGDTTIGSQSTSSTFWAAQGFLMGSKSVVLDTVAAAVSPGAHLFLYRDTDLNHLVPGTLITALTDTGTHNALGDEIYKAPTAETLTAGDGYSIAMMGTGAWATTFQAATNGYGTMAPGDAVDLGGGWFDLSGGEKLQMAVTAVPEPSTIGLVAVGAVLCYIRARLHRTRGGLRLV